MKVFVYFNLHKKCWSIKALEGEEKNRVIAHADRVTLCDAVGKVSKAGRQRVLKEKRKNVHAGIVGFLGSAVKDNKPLFKSLPIPDDTLDRVLGGLMDYKPREITYNPYKFETFVYKDDESEFTGSLTVFLNSSVNGVTVSSFELM